MKIVKLMTTQDYSNPDTRTKRQHNSVCTVLQMFVWITCVVLMGSVSAGLSYQYSPASYYNYFREASALPPLFIMADSPYSVARTTTEVPLLVVSTNSLRTIHDGRISSISPTQPLITCQTNKYTTVSFTTFVMLNIIV